MVHPSSALWLGRSLRCDQCPVWSTCMLGIMVACSPYDGLVLRLTNTINLGVTPTNPWNPTPTALDSLTPTTPGPATHLPTHPPHTPPSPRTPPPLDPHHPLDPTTSLTSTTTLTSTTSLTPTTSTTLWQSFVYSFGHYFMDRTT